MQTVQPNYSGANKDLASLLKVLFSSETYLWDV